MDISAEQLRWVFIYVFVLIVSVALHEFGHAFMADRLGDDTPRRQGRVTLNPLAHADPIGTLLLPLLGGLYGAASGMAGGFGWGKPVQWQPSRIRRGISMSTAKILVAVAGPGMNLVLAIVLAFVHVLLITQHVLSPVGDLSRILRFAATTNIVLMFFNLLPVPPLDGGHVADSFVPYKHRRTADDIFRFAPFFLLLPIMTIPAFRQVFLIPANWCTSGIYGLFGALVA